MSKLLLGTAAIAVLSIGMSTASLSADKAAPDVGGTCCSDLEERVAELESSVVRKGNQKMSLTLTGQVNTAIIWHNVDELDQQYKIIDNKNSESRISLKGTARINTEWTAGFKISLGLADATNIDQDINVRESFLFLRVKGLGTFKLGQHGTATDGINEISLSSGASNASTLGTLTPFDSFIQDQTGILLDNPFDGTRKQAASFTTGSLGGFSISAAWADDDSWDAALRFAGEFGSIQVGAGIGYRDETQVVGASRKYYGGSASIKEVTSGLFVDASYGKSEGEQTGSFSFGGFSFPFILADTTVELIGGRVGIDAKLSPVGPTTIFGEYQMLRIDGIDDEAILYGLGLNQAINSAAMDIYISYRHIDTGSVLGETADVVVGGAKIKF